MAVTDSEEMAVIYLACWFNPIGHHESGLKNKAVLIYFIGVSWYVSDSCGKCIFGDDVTLNVLLDWNLDLLFFNVLVV